MIRITKPNIPDLKEQGFMLADMHVHSKRSDGNTTAKQISKFAEKKEMFVAMKDHNNINPRAKDFSNIIPGIEITTKEKSE